MKKNNSSKQMIIGIIIAIIIVFLVSVSVMQRDKKNESGPIQSTGNDLVAKVDKAISFPLRAFEATVSSVTNLFGTYQENSQLKKRLDSYASLENQNLLLEKENQALKDQLELTATISSYEQINANVISRSPDDWQNILIIDRGTNDGIEANMPVMGRKGLIGRVIVANKSSSKVELLTSRNQNSNHFPIMVVSEKGETAYGLMENYLDEEESLVITQLTTTKDIHPGDQVLTSGLGSTSPKGLLIGEVKKVNPTKYGLEQEVYVTPASSLYDISVVTVVKRLVGSELEE
ncbi:rod shape-determining protein MreC [Vagococcus lutrae]|uniref:rod shape-determining protein MreC n=1 Tax=Vagococcus lutrae TaxID=81947 RepID=UPI00144473CE|nr:rod shape-determining protein MreC [Vagococcus lutrae]NKZ27397.1 rod shape-determining protein MreC [Vagococcus lutrae]